MFRLVVAVLAVVGLVSLFSSASGAVAGAGLLLLLPLLLVAKILFFVMLFGFIGRGCARWGSPRKEPSWEWRRPRPRERNPRSREDDFEEWHRMAHAREEVDSWAPDVE